MWLFGRLSLRAGKPNRPSNPELSHWAGVYETDASGPWLGDGHGGGDGCCEAASCGPWHRMGRLNE